MSKTNKQLLIKDLTARLSYHPMLQIKNMDGETKNVQLNFSNINYVEKLGKDLWIECKPYLRPMSSMTEKEKEYYLDIMGGQPMWASNACELINWLNQHHFDYRGLITKGLALEAPKDMYEQNS